MAIARRHNLPIALKLAYGVATPLIGVVYARSYGPKNFLWLSDIALGLTTAAVIMEERFDRLDAPVLRVTYPDTHSPFAQALEQANLPSASKIVDALRKLAAY